MNFLYVREILRSGENEVRMVENSFGSGTDQVSVQIQMDMFEL
jgi:hypothetical protein